MKTKYIITVLFICFPVASIVKVVLLANKLYLGILAKWSKIKKVYSQYEKSRTKYGIANDDGTGTRTRYKKKSFDW